MANNNDSWGGQSSNNNFADSGNNNNEADAVPDPAKLLEMKAQFAAKGNGKGMAIIDAMLAKGAGKGKKSFGIQDNNDYSSGGALSRPATPPRTNIITPAVQVRFLLPFRVPNSKFQKIMTIEQ